MPTIMDRFAESHDDQGRPLPAGEDVTAEYPPSAEDAAHAFNMIGMNDDLATYLAAFLVTRGDPEAATNLLDYCRDYYDRAVAMRDEMIQEYQGND